METTKAISVITSAAKSLKIIAGVLIFLSPFFSWGQRLSETKLDSFENEHSEEYRITSLKAKYVEGKVYFMWTVFEPSNECVYRLERSNDNKTFKSVYEVKGAKSPGNIELLNSFVDEGPLKGISYYRVKRFTTEESTAGAAVVVNVPESQNEAQVCIELQLRPLAVVN